MARIRSIKPEFWTDGNMVRLSPFARLLFIGSWNFALCDRGHLPDDPVELKLKILPADSVDADELVEEILKLGRFERGATGDGRRWLRIIHLPNHQKVDPRWTPRCPYCVAESNPDETHRDSPKLPDTPASNAEPPGDAPESGGDTTQEGKGREGKGEEGKGTSTSAEPTRDVVPARPEIERLCNHLADRIERNGSKRPTITKRWRDAVRLMLDNDGRTEEQIRGAIDWCQADDFWRSNILSAPKLREKYDQLRLAANRNGSAGPRRSTTDDRVAQAQALKARYAAAQPPLNLVRGEIAQ